MSAMRLDFLVAAVGGTVLGLVVGFAAAGGGAHAEEHADEHAHEHEAGVEFSSAALANLGIEIGPVVRGDHEDTRDLPAVLVEAPLASMPLASPVDGMVVELKVVPGSVVRPGEVVARLLRSSQPMPDLALAGPLLLPGSERVHEALVRLHEAHEELGIVELEEKRLAQVTAGEDPALPVVPRQRLVELGYQRIRAEKARELARMELRKHGYADAEIEAMCDGAPAPVPTAEHWQRALQRNGLWNDLTARLHEALPQGLRSSAVATAAVGELTGRGMLDPALVEWVAGDKSAADNFVAVAGILTQGRSLADVRALHALGALQPVVELRAPAREGLDAWDVAELSVAPGAQVAAGAPVVVLHDASHLWLRVEPVGGDGALLVSAVEGAESCRAVPLLPGTGAELEGLVPQMLRSGDHGSVVAHARVANSLLSEGPPRSWRLQSGMRYRLQVPVRTFRGVFVLPAAAIAEQGPELVVFLQDGASFHPVEVEVLHRDNEVALVQPGGALFPGDVVALSGAFAIAAAMQGGGEAGGHHHHH